MRLLLALLLLPTSAFANTITPNFTQGSMNSTTTTTVDISRTIATETYGGDYKSWSGTNVSPSGSLDDPNTTFTVIDTSQPYQLEVVTRVAGLIELSNITETITQSSTTTSLSVFSQ